MYEPGLSLRKWNLPLLSAQVLPLNGMFTPERTMVSCAFREIVFLGSTICPCNSRRFPFHAPQTTAGVRNSPKIKLVAAADTLRNKRCAENSAPKEVPVLAVAAGIGIKLKES